MIRLAIWVVCVIWAGSVSAQSIPIRSGEHPTFSRLVIPVPDTSAWSLKRGGPGYILDLGTQSGDFDTGNVFSRLTQGRIASVESLGDGRLALVPACECHATAFVFDSRTLVVDLVDGAPPIDSPFEARDVPAPTASLPLITSPAARAIPNFAETMAVDDSKAPPDLSAVEAALLQSIARAASQGLLDPPAPRPPDRAPADAAPGGDALAPAATAQVSTDLDLGMQDPVIGVRSATVIDRDMPLSIPAISPTNDDGVTCLPDSYFAIGSWVETDDFAREIASRRAGLTAEFDQYPDGAVLDLARAYVYFGYGKEAQRALDLDGIRSQERAVLVALASLVDGDPPRDPVLQTQMTCTTAAGFWAFLAQPVGFQGPRPDVRLLQANFRDLPVPLKGHLGTALAERLAAMGEGDLAEQILSRASAALTGATGEQDLVTADVLAAGGEADAAIATLAAAAQTDERLSPEALLRLLELAHEQQTTVDPNVFALSESLRFENRRDPVARRLLIAEVRAYGDLGDFDNAIRTLTEGLDAPATRDEAEKWAALASETMIALTATADDLTFLRHALDGPPEILTAGAENGLARRLLALGFADRAAQFLLGEAQGPDMGERRYLRAEAALAMGAPDEALRHLSGLTDLRAARLRTAAHVAKGDFGAAYAASEATPGSMPEVENAWRAGAWARLAGSDDPLLRTAGSAMLTPAEPYSGQASLDGSRTALEASAQTRQLIDDLLTRFQVPSNGF